MRRDQGFVLAPLRVGALYRVRGGHIMRYQGLWGTDNVPGPGLVRGQFGLTQHCLALSHPSVPVHAPAVGYSAAHADVRMLTAQDLEWLPKMVESAKAKGVEYRAAEIAIEELLNNA